MTISNENNEKFSFCKDAHNLCNKNIFVFFARFLPVNELHLFWDRNSFLLPPHFDVLFDYPHLFKPQTFVCSIFYILVFKRLRVFTIVIIPLNKLLLWICIIDIKAPAQSHWQCCIIHYHCLGTKTQCLVRLVLFNPHRKTFYRSGLLLLAFLFVERINLLKCKLDSGWLSGILMQHKYRGSVATSDENVRIMVNMYLSVQRLWFFIAQYEGLLHSFP